MASRRISLPNRLLLLVCMALLPLVVLAITGLTLLGRQQRLEARDALVERSRALRSAMDQELASSIAALKVLALSESLDAADLRHFHAQAQLAVKARPDWDGLILIAPDGRRLLNTRTPYGSPLPGGAQAVEQASLVAVLKGRLPVTGSITRGPGGQYRFPVRVPVMRGDELRYVLTAFVRPDGMRALMAQQNIPVNSVMTVFDGEGNIVARSRNQEEFLGTAVSATLMQLMAANAEGVGPTLTRDSQQVVSAYSRSLASGWGVALGQPAEDVEAPLLRSYAFYAAGFVLSLVLAGLAAAWLSRRIGVRVAQLRDAAQALGQGLKPVLPLPGIPEVDEVAAALADADTQLRVSEQRLRELNASLERRVAERTQDLERANQELQAANRELEAFSYSVSHDLRGPVRAMDGFSSLLEQEAGASLSAEAQRCLGLVRSSAHHMGELIDDLLAFSRLGREPLRRRSVDMQQLVRECVDRLHGEHPGRSVDCVLGELPPCQADSAMLRQVLMNLIGNAYKYTVRTHHARVDIGAQRASSNSADGSVGETVYHVRDNGIGFDMQYVNKIFGVFQRLHGSGQFEGTGVGLAIVQRILERHGGRVWAEAEPGKGACFYFTVGSHAAATGAGA